MRVFVTGAQGQLGRALLATAPAGWQCTGLGRGELDLQDRVAIARMIESERPDWVINAGAYTAVDRAESERARAHVVNAEAPAAIAEALARYGGRLLQLSTDYVFSGRRKRPYRPDDLADPLSVYGRSKRAGEVAAGEQALVLRTSAVYAPGGRNFVTAMLGAMRQGKALRVVSDQVTAPTYAPGLAQTAWALARRGAQGIFHHRDGGQASWHEFAVAIAEEAVRMGLLSEMPAIIPVTSVQYGAPAPRPAYSVLDDSATRALLGDRPAHWRESLRRMLKEELALG